MVPQSSRPGRAVIITYAGSGLGRDAALGFAAKGYIVFGTALSAAEVQDLKESSRGRVSLTVCNITNVDAVQAWAGGISDALGDAGISILINNSTSYTPGPLEIVPLNAIKHEFEVTVFGALSVINAFLPALRKAHGRIVHVGAWVSTLPLPFNGSSRASEAAIAVLSAVYRDELKPFGIDVIVVSSSRISGDGREASAAFVQAAKSMSPEYKKLYGKALGKVRVKLDSQHSLCGSTVEVAERLIQAAEHLADPATEGVEQEVPSGDMFEAELGDSHKKISELDQG